MCKTISLISCKGGVGKTTSAVNISSYIHKKGKRVLAVDLDFQHNLCKHFEQSPTGRASADAQRDIYRSGQ